MTKNTILEKVETYIGDYKVKIQDKNSSIGTLQKKVNELHEEIEKEKKLNYDLEQVYKSLKDYKKIQDVIPKEVLKLKKDYFKTKKLLQSEDITIKKQRELQEKVRNLKQEIKNKCNHKVFYFHVDQGCRSWDDYPDPEYRKCLICGLEEKGNHYKEEEFKKIKYKDALVVQYTWQYNDDLKKLGLKYEAVEEFILSFGVKELEKYCLYPLQKSLLNKILGLKL